MTKLLRANFSRMWKAKIFWLCVIVSALCGVLMCVSSYLRVLQYDQKVVLENVFFPSFCFIGIAVAVFCSIFIGTEYSDGTIRNKIIVGCTREDIYFSNFITCAVASILIEGAYLAVVCALGIPMLGLFTYSPVSVLLLTAIGLLMIIAFAAIFSLLAMLNSNKALVAILSLLLIFVALIFATYLYSRLGEPEFYSDFSISTTTNADGTTVVESNLGGTPIPNPLYLDDTQRAIYQTLLDVLPTGQGLQLLYCAVSHPAQTLFYSVLIIAVSTILGVLIFRRKDLK